MRPEQGRQEPTANDTEAARTTCPSSGLRAAGSGRAAGLQVPGTPGGDTGGTVPLSSYYVRGTDKGPAAQSFLKFQLLMTAGLVPARAGTRPLSVASCSPRATAAVKRPGFDIGLRVHISAQTLTGELLTLCVQFSLSLYPLEAILPYSPNLRRQRLKDTTLFTHQQKRKKPKWGIR